MTGLRRVNAQPLTTAFPVMAESYPLPPLAEVRELLSYCSVTGELTWRIFNRSISPGSRAGTTQIDGYRRVRLRGRNYKAHRLAWLLHYGVDPGRLHIDHIDGNRSNNAIDNLRLCTQRQNSRNIPIKKNNTSGVPGVSWHHHTKKWRAYVNKDRKQHYLGVFETLHEAVAARNSAAALLHGEFGRQYCLPN
jgi:hypothetical protein